MNQKANTVEQSSADTVITITVATEADAKDWDAFVMENESSTFFHRFGWFRVISETMGHKPHYLIAKSSAKAQKDVSGQPLQSDQIVGVLPLFEVKSFLFGHSLVSLPFAVYGGAVAQTPDIQKRLERYAAGLAEGIGVDYLELRNVERSQPDWPYKSIHSTFIREIATNDDDNLALVKYKQRAVVRKALKNGFVTEFKDALNIDEFFYAYSTSVKNLGTPVFGRSYFRALKEEFGEDCEIVSIKQDGELHCALMSFYFKNQVLPYYGGGLPVCRQSKGMDFMYFDQMCRAGAEGHAVYDFGRSKNDTGPFNYKRHWGFEPKPLHYEYHLVKADHLPELNPNNPKYQLMIQVWQKLPLWLSQFMGPLVSKYLG